MTHVRIGTYAPRETIYHRPCCTTTGTRSSGSRVRQKKKTTYRIGIDRLPSLATALRAAHISLAPKRVFITRIVIMRAYICVYVTMLYSLLIVRAPVEHARARFTVSGRSRIIIRVKIAVNSRTLFCLLLLAFGFVTPASPFAEQTARTRPFRRLDYAIFSSRFVQMGFSFTHTH